MIDIQPTLIATQGPWGLTRAATGQLFVSCPQTGVVARLVEDELLFTGSMIANAALICAAPNMRIVLQRLSRIDSLPQAARDDIDNVLMLAQNPPGAR
jgi:hypothetical protein